MSGYATQEKAAVIVSSRGTLNTNKHNNNSITYLVYKLTVLATYMLPESDNPLGLEMVRELI